MVASVGRSLAPVVASVFCFLCRSDAFALIPVGRFGLQPPSDGVRPRICVVGALTSLHHQVKRETRQCAGSKTLASLGYSAEAAPDRNSALLLKKELEDASGLEVVSKYSREKKQQ
jgi:hypothetical protein